MERGVERRSGTGSGTKGVAAIVPDQEVLTHRHPTSPYKELFRFDECSMSTAFLHSVLLDGCLDSALPVNALSCETGRYPIATVIAAALKQGKRTQSTLSLYVFRFQEHSERSPKNLCSNCSMQNLLIFQC